MKKILITGGAGYIGSHCAISLLNNGYIPVIVDNLSNSRQDVLKKIEVITKKKIIFYKEDLRNKEKINLILKKNKIYGVIHCAALKAVGESTKKPLDYFENNLCSTLSLLKNMEKNNIFKIIFSSSATVYDNSESLPWNESSLTGKTKNPYGKSKFIIEEIFKDLAKFDKRWTIRIARYFNPIGNHHSGLIKENPKGTPNNLFPIIVNVLKKKNSYLKIFGKNYPTKDGTCIRDYIHVMDLAEGHTALLKKDILKKGIQIYNFGSGKGVSVLDIVRKFEKVIGKTIPVKFTSRRDGETVISFCCSKKALKKLNWKCKFDINTAIKDIKKNMDI
jgi:UDP-glucose 4-epimerase